MDEPEDVNNPSVFRLARLRRLVVGNNLHKCVWDRLLVCRSECLYVSTSLAEQSHRSNYLLSVHGFLFGLLVPLRTSAISESGKFNFSIPLHTQTKLYIAKGLSILATDKSI